MIISFAFKENNSTVCRSRVKRQEWEQRHALQEKQKRIQAIHDTQDTQETQVRNIWGFFSPLVMFF